MKFFQDNEKIFNWLDEFRGINEWTAFSNGIGWNPEDFYLKRKDWGLDEKENKGRDLYFPQGLIIPCFKNGRVIRVRFRKAKLRKDRDNDPRYIILAGSSMTPLILLQRIGRLRAVIIVESELDALLIWEIAGDFITVIAMGNASARPDEAATRILNRAAFIMNALDYDEAGAKVWSRWHEEYQDSIRWPVPEGKDPGDYYKKHKGNIREWIIAGLPRALKPAA